MIIDVHASESRPWRRDAIVVIVVFHLDEHLRIVSSRPLTRTLRRTGWTMHHKGLAGA
jgi:hypothetical protein